MDFGGHGLSSHYSSGVPYYHQTFVSEIRRVVAALKWNRFSILGHSFGGIVGGMFSCIFPEMVNKLILLDSPLLLLESNEVENLLTYKRRTIEHMLQVEASQEPSRVYSLKQLLQRLLKSNSHLNEECGELLLQRGTTKVAAGLVLNRDQRLSWPENSVDLVSRELYAHSIRKLQAHVLFIKAVHGYFDVRRENYSDKESLSFMIHTLKSTLKEVRRGSGSWCPATVTHSGPTSPISSRALGRPLVWPQAQQVTTRISEASRSTVVGP
ncbi:serine hydrolase-like protein 2 isoform X5 [Macaca fascicularis]